MTERGTEVPLRIWKRDDRKGKRKREKKAIHVHHPFFRFLSAICLKFWNTVTITHVLIFCADENPKAILASRKQGTEGL
jgi:hypothetical protein